MLKPRALAEVLKQVNTGGVHSTLLLNSEGALLAYSGVADKNSFVISALVSNIWNLYERLGYNTNLNDKLDIIYIECMGGFVVMKRVQTLLLCLYTKDTTTCHLGMLKIKMQALSDYLLPYLQKLII